MPICNIFDLSSTLDADSCHLSWELTTDLPRGSLLSIECTRTYSDDNGHTWLWTLHDDEVCISPLSGSDLNGASGKLHIDQGDAAGLDEFNEALASYPKGISGSISPEIRVSLVLGGRQRLKAFGRNNCALTGSQVSEEGGIQVISSATTHLRPMLSKFHPNFGF